MPTRLCPTVPVKPRNLRSLPCETLSPRRRVSVSSTVCRARDSCHQPWNANPDVSLQHTHRPRGAPWLPVPRDPGSLCPPSPGAFCPCMLSFSRAQPGPAHRTVPKAGGLGSSEGLGVAPPALRPLQKESPLVSHKMYIPTSALPGPGQLPRRLLKC